MNRRPCGPTEAGRALALWQEGRSLAEVAAGLGVSCWQARCLLRQAGVISLGVVRCDRCGREIVHGRRGLPGREAALCLDCLASQPETPFPQRLRAHRLAAGLTQEELAERSGLSGTSIWQYEQGEAVPRATSLARLAKVFGPGFVSRTGHREAGNGTPCPPGSPANGRR